MEAGWMGWDALRSMGRHEHGTYTAYPQLPYHVPPQERLSSMLVCWLQEGKFGHETWTKKNTWLGAILRMF